MEAFANKELSFEEHRDYFVLSDELVHCLDETIQGDEVIASSKAASLVLFAQQFEVHSEHFWSLVLSSLDAGLSELSSQQLFQTLNSLKL